MYKLSLLMFGLFVSNFAEAGFVDTIADKVEVVGILGNEHAGVAFDGIIVLKMDSGRLAFLRLNDVLPGYAGIAIVKVEKKRVYIGARGGAAAPLMWLTSGDSGGNYSSRSMDLIGDESPSGDGASLDDDQSSPAAKTKRSGNSYRDSDSIDDSIPPPPPVSDDGEYGYNDDFIAE